MFARLLNNLNASRPKSYSINRLDHHITTFPSTITRTITTIQGIKKIITPPINSFPLKRYSTHNHENKNGPILTSRRRMADQRGRGKGGIDESENPDGSMMEQAPRERQPEYEAGNYRNQSRNTLPEQLRGSGSVFRRGLDVPRLNNKHWLNSMLLEPWIALKGNNIVWWDTQVRFTKLGFIGLHLASLIAAGFITYHAPKFFWMDFHDNMDRSRHLYMIDVAKLLWLQQAIRNCELMIQNRKNGLAPGLLIGEALQDIEESPFRTTQYRQTNDIMQRADQWRQAEEKEFKRRTALGQQIWGDYTPSELDELRENKRRVDSLRDLKRSSMSGFNSQMNETQELIRERVGSTKADFRSRYIQPYLPTTTPASPSAFPILSNATPQLIPSQQHSQQQSSSQSPSSQSMLK